MTAVVSLDPPPLPASQAATELRFVVATGFVSPYVLPVFQALVRRVGKLTVLVSTPMDANRNWKPDWGDVDVRVQRTWRLERNYRDPAGYAHQTYIYVPRDTLHQLGMLKPDVIISSGLGLRSAACAMYCRLHRPTALIFWHAASEHSEKKWGTTRHWLRRRLLLRADALLANGNSGTRYLQSLGCPRTKIFHGPYVAIPRVFDSGPVERSAEHAHRLLYAGRLLDWKGLLPFIEVLKRFAEEHPGRSLEFTLVGSGPLEPTLRGLTTPANLRVQILPEHAPQDLTACYQQSGIFVFPTFDDEWGLVVNEALASGLPVLGSMYSQAVEDLCNERTGWRFHPDKPEEMYQALSQALATSPEELNLMRLAGREAVRHLTPEYVADRLVEAALAARNDNLPPTVQQGTSA